VQRVIVVDARGSVIAATPREPSLIGGTLDLSSYAVPPNLLRELAAPVAPVRRLYPDPAHGRVFLAWPLSGTDGRYAGALLAVTTASDAPPLAAGLLALALVGLVVQTVAAGLAGTLSGALTARAFTRRVDALVRATGAWGRGDFAQPIDDAAPDEIGQLAAHLSGVSAQLQGLVAARQQLATLDERNRLARDLHDSVKQQVFAISMTLSTAQLLWEQDPAQARARLDAATALAQQAQQELAALIGTLRPAPLPTGRYAALRELAQACPVATRCDAPDDPALPGEVEQALYRIAQEAPPMSRGTAARRARA
jgi:signal transduction histidine kinase